MEFTRGWMIFIYVCCFCIDDIDAVGTVPRKISLGGDQHGPNFGLVKGDDGVICAADWGEAEATVVCRQLGLPSKHAVPIAFSAIEKENQKSWNVTCKGQETDLNDCFWPSYRLDCVYYAGVVCVDDPVDASSNDSQCFPLSVVIYTGISVGVFVTVLMVVVLVLICRGKSSKTQKTSADLRENKTGTLSNTEKNATTEVKRRTTKTVKYVKGNTDTEEVKVIETAENYEIPDGMPTFELVPKDKPITTNDFGYIHSLHMKPAGTRDTGYVTMSRDQNAGSVQDTYINNIATPPKKGLKRAKTFIGPPSPPDQCLKKGALRGSEVVTYVNDEVASHTSKPPVKSPPTLPRKTAKTPTTAHYANLPNLLKGLIK